MDKDVGKILGYWMKVNKGNSLNSVSKGIVRLINCGVDFATIDTETKCAYFEEDVARLAQKMPHLAPLIDYLERENYQTNLD